MESLRVSPRRNWRNVLGLVAAGIVMILAIVLIGFLISWFGQTRATTAEGGLVQSTNSGAALEEAKASVRNGSENDLPTIAESATATPIGVIGAYATVDPDTVAGLDPSMCLTRAETDLLLFGTDEQGRIRDILVEIGTEGQEPDNNTGGAYVVNVPEQLVSFTFTLPEGWFATAHEPGQDKPRIYRGEVTLTVFRVTIRNPHCYLPTDRINEDPSGCSLLEAENLNGATQDWTFDVLPGNIDCENAPTANVEGNLAANRSTELPAECPRFAGFTTAPGNDGAPFCKYQGDMVTGIVPAGYNAQYWNGALAYASAGDTISANEVTFRRSVN